VDVGVRTGGGSGVGASVSAGTGTKKNTGARAGTGSSAAPPVRDQVTDVRDALPLAP
jgi:hypothetical protein